jgi:hypothetical protein
MRDGLSPFRMLSSPDLPLRWTIGHGFRSEFGVRHASNDDSSGYPATGFLA